MGSGERANDPAGDGDESAIVRSSAGSIPPASSSGSIPAARQRISASLIALFHSRSSSRRSISRCARARLFAPAAAAFLRASEKLRGLADRSTEDGMERLSSRSVARPRDGVRVGDCSADLLCCAKLRRMWSGCSLSTCGLTLRRDAFVDHRSPACRVGMDTAGVAPRGGEAPMDAFGVPEGA